MMQDRHHGICDATKGETGASCAKGGNVVDVTEAFEVNDEVALLGRFNGATPEGGVDVKGGGLRVRWCVDDDGRYLLKRTPVAAEVGGIDLGVERRSKSVVAGI